MVGGLAGKAGGFGSSAGEPSMVSQARREGRRRSRSVCGLRSGVSEWGGDGVELSCWMSKMCDGTREGLPGNAANLSKASTIDCLRRVGSNSRSDRGDGFSSWSSRSSLPASGWQSSGAIARHEGLLHSRGGAGSPTHGSTLRRHGSLGEEEMAECVLKRVVKDLGGSFENGGGNTRIQSAIDEPGEAEVVTVDSQLHGMLMYTKSAYNAVTGFDLSKVMSAATRRQTKRMGGGDRPRPSGIVS